MTKKICFTGKRIKRRKQEFWKQAKWITEEIERKVEQAREEMKEFFKKEILNQGLKGLWADIEEQLIEGKKK